MTGSRRQPEGPAPDPVVQRLRVRYTKRGRLRFLSHRDIARAFERAIRRAALPIGFSAGFSPHPKISWVGAAPTGVASEAEYVELGLTETRDPDDVARALDAALPPDLDVVECLVAAGGALPERIDGSSWRWAVPHADAPDLAAAIERLLAAPTATVARMTKHGLRDLDVRAVLVGLRLQVEPGSGPADAASACVTMEAVVRLGSPVVRPDDVLAALRDVAGFQASHPLSAVRTAQGRLDDSGRLVDPLGVDRAAALAASEVGAGTTQGSAALAAPPEY